MDYVNPTISVEYAEQAVIVTLTQHRILEENDIQTLADSIMPLVEQNAGKKLIIDFSSVEFFSSSVLGLLIRISKKVYEGDGALRLCCIEPKIMKVFKITRLDKVFDIYATQEMAISD